MRWRGGGVVEGEGRGCKNVQHPKSNIQSPTSKVQHPKSNIQSPTSKVQHPKSNIQSPTSKVQHPKSNIQSPTSKVQHPKSKVGNCSSTSPNHLLRGEGERSPVFRARARGFSTATTATTATSQCRRAFLSVATATSGVVVAVGTGIPHQA